MYLHKITTILRDIKQHKSDMRILKKKKHVWFFYVAHKKAAREKCCSMPWYHKKHTTVS